MAPEQRRHQRHPVQMRVKMRLPGGDVDALTQQVAHEGFSLRLPEPLPVGTVCSFIVHLPDGTAHVGKAECRNVSAGALCGFSLSFEDDSRRHWQAFIAQEEHTGSLWRMIGRYTAPSGTARGFVLDEIPNTNTGAMTFHTVGENGEAYRILFERGESDLGPDADLMAVPGFQNLAERAVHRVLREPVTIKLVDDAPAQSVRVVELNRGGYAYVETGGQTATLVSLGVGEVMLIDCSDMEVFPSFTDEELERIACDTFRRDLPEPMFGRPEKISPAPVLFDAPPDVTGLDAVRRAQDGAAHVETRLYGERKIDLFPQVWARAVDDGHALMGPVMRDGDRALLLVLVGPKAPRVLRLSADSEVALLGRR